MQKLFNSNGKAKFATKQNIEEFKILEESLLKKMMKIKLLLMKLPQK